MARLLPLLLALACADVESAAAAQRALEWARGVELVRPIVHCHKCDGGGCFCDVNTKGGLYPLRCNQNGCEVRIR